MCVYFTTELVAEQQAKVGVGQRNRQYDEWRKKHNIRTIHTQYMDSCAHYKLFDATTVFTAIRPL